MTRKEEHLFPEMNPARYGANRQKRPLFIPTYLKRESQDQRLQDERQKRAHEILVKWADLESSGALQSQTESNLEAEFLTQVFGEALGYTLFSEGQKQWNLKPKFRLNDQTADAAIGFFEAHREVTPRAVIELKSPTINLDKDRPGGRTPVQQCWDYLAEVPECPWGIVCNCVSFRLYHRDHSPRVYELFTLQDLRKKEIFLQFYWLFERGGLLPAGFGQVPRADQLLEWSNKKQREVGDSLYEDYDRNRRSLIMYLTGPAHNKSLDEAIRIAQKLVDRIVFVAFCEDRDLLPERSLARAWDEVPPFSRVTNPRWQNFLNLFRSVDEGNETHGISGYDGGLFRKDPAVDDLQLDDEWTKFFRTVGGYDFRYELNVDVLGHLFEKSIHDIEKVRSGSLFETSEPASVPHKMAKSSERKKGGIYYTPPEFTRFITRHTVAVIAGERIDAIARKYKVDPVAMTKQHGADGKAKRFVEESIAALRDIKVVDPACGSGAFLIQAYDTLEEYYLDLCETLESVDPKGAATLRGRIPEFILHDNLFGVDLSPEAVEITQLALWLRSAQRGKTLADLSQNIVRGNSLVADPEIDSAAMRWQDAFPAVFSRKEPGFDCVIGNPPWERMKLQEREFFDSLVPEIATAVNAATRRQLIAELEKKSPEIYQRYLTAKVSAEKTLDHVRNSGRFPLCGKGDINTYAVFTELAKTIVAHTGRVGLLVPSGIATDDTTKDFFRELIEGDLLIGLYDFENRKKIFPDVDGRFKFSVLLFGGRGDDSKEVDFVFFAHEMDDLREKDRHISLSRDDFKRLNPNTLTCPIFRSRRDAEITKAIYRRVPVLVDRTRKEGGNPWGIKFVRMFDQTNDAELFRTAEQLKADGFKRDGGVWRKRKALYLPLYEAKMAQIYDHRAASVITKDTNWMRQGQTDATSLVQHQNPEFTVEPRWWVDSKEVVRVVGKELTGGFLAFKDITSPTNQRTMIAAAIPWTAVTNHLPLLLTEQPPRRNMCLLANLNTFVLDYATRQKIGGVTLNFFIVEQLPVFGPDFYEQSCPWSKRRKLGAWIAERALELTCVSNDMKPLAEAAGFKPLVHKWDQTERNKLQAELDAAFFLLYGLVPKDVEYILSTFAGLNKDQEPALISPKAFDRILAHYHELREAAGA
jgi:hypothetical protein